MRAPSSLTASPPELRSSPGPHTLASRPSRFLPSWPSLAQASLPSIQLPLASPHVRHMSSQPSAGPCSASLLLLAQTVTSPPSLLPAGSLECPPIFSAVPASLPPQPSPQAAGPGQAHCPSCPESPLAGLDPRPVTVSVSIPKWQINLTAFGFLPNKASMVV